MNDDELIARLRHATTDVPPSRLDPEAVLRSSRRKRTGYRTALAAGCVAAVAGVGAVTPALAEMLPDGGASLGQVGPAAAGSSVLPGCAGPVELEWLRGETAPVIRHAMTVDVGPEGTTTSSEAIAYAAAPIVRSNRGPLPERVVQQVLRVAAEQDEAGIYRDGDLVPEGTALVIDGTGGVAPDSDENGPIDAWDLKPPFEGFQESSAAPPATPLVPAGSEAGTYVAYDQGVQHRIEGRATCGDGERPFELEFQTQQDFGVLACIEPAQTSIELALQESLCPDGPARHDELEIDIDPGAVGDLLATLGLPQG